MGILFLYFYRCTLVARLPRSNQYSKGVSLAIPIYRLGDNKLSGATGLECFNQKLKEGFPLCRNQVRFGQKNSMVKMWSYLLHRPLILNTKMSDSTLLASGRHIFVLRVPLGRLCVWHGARILLGTRELFWKITFGWFSLADYGFSMMFGPIRESQGKIYFQAAKAIFIYTPGTEGAGEATWKVWKPDTEFMLALAFRWQLLHASAWIWPI